MYFFKITILTILFWLPTASAQEFSSYETVNGAPQFSEGDGRFSLYWALWRGFSEQERSWIEAASRPALVSRRQLNWQVSLCEEDTVIHRDGEDFFYFDELKLDQDHKIIPIKEANRRDYRYINMVTFSSLQMRGAGRIERKRRKPGQTSQEVEAEYQENRDKWRQKTTIERLKGAMIVRASHRMYSNVDATYFLDLKDYTKLGTPLYEEFSRFAPYTWPVYYDERAHKPHHISEPFIWQELPENELKFSAVFVWNNCGEELQAKMVFPEGSLPPSGPNRPGRPDGGISTLPIEILNAQEFTEILIQTKLPQ